MPAAKKTAAKAKEAPKKAPPTKADSKPKVSVDPKVVVKLRDEDELGFKEIGAKVGVGRSQAEVLYMRGKLSKKDIITFVDLADIGDQVVELRDKEQLSWGQISARTNVPEGSLRKLYRDTSGNSDVGNRIGKGGRYPNGTTPPKKAAKTAKEVAAAKATNTGPKKGKQPDLNPGKKNVQDMTLEELQTRLNGKKATYGRGSAKPENFTIKTVNKLNPKGTIDVTLSNGKPRTLGLANFVRVAK